MSRTCRHIPEAAQTKGPLDTSARRLCDAGKQLRVDNNRVRSARSVVAYTPARRRAAVRDETRSTAHPAGEAPVRIGWTHAA
jgi:hypothetical protein